MKDLLKNKWAWAVFILVVINVAMIGVLCCYMCGRGGKMKCHRGEMSNHCGHGYEKGCCDFKHGHGGHKGKDFLSNELKLTEEQNASLEILRKAHLEKVHVYMDSMQVLKKELMKSLGKTDAETDPIIQKIAAQEIRIEKEKFDHFNKLYAICTDSQKVILKEKFENAAAHHDSGCDHKSGEKCEVNNCADAGSGKKSCCSMHKDSSNAH